MQPDGFEKERAILLHRVLKRARKSLRRAERVPLADRRRPPILRVDRRTLPAAELADAVPQRLRRVILRAVVQKLDHPPVVRLPAEAVQPLELFDLRSKRDSAFREEVVERLDAEAVARHEERALFPIPKAEREHPAKVRETVLAPVSVGRRNHLRVAVGLKLVSRRAQLRAQLAVVVNLAVENDLVAVAAVGQWLVAARREIENTQPPVREFDLVFAVAEIFHTAPVRPAMRNVHQAILRVPFSEKTPDAAHASRVLSSKFSAQRSFRHLAKFRNSVLPFPGPKETE